MYFCYKGKPLVFNKTVNFCIMFYFIIGLDYKCNALDPLPIRQKHRCPRKTVQRVESANRGPEQTNSNNVAKCSFIKGLFKRNIQVYCQL